MGPLGGALVRGLVESGLGAFQVGLQIFLRTIELLRGRNTETIAAFFERLCHVDLFFF